MTRKRKRRSSARVLHDLAGNEQALHHSPIGSGLLMPMEDAVITLSDSDDAVESKVPPKKIEYIVISDDEDKAEELEGNKENVSPARLQIRELLPPVTLIPKAHWWRGYRRFEHDLALTKRYTPEWLVRPQAAGRRISPASRFWRGEPGCWLEDYNPKQFPANSQRRAEPDALPRWFGPLTYTVIHFNHNRLPRDSLEFFQLCFQPTQPGDLEVWTKYRQIEENIWVEKLDHHPAFKRIIGALHGLAFGQLEYSTRKIVQMDRLMEMFQVDVEAGGQAWNKRNYFLAAARDGLNGA